MFELDFQETSAAKPMSIQDRKFLEQMEESAKLRDDGHFELPLPLKVNPPLPNNKPLAEKRKLMQNPKIKEDYVKYMTDLIKKGYTEEVPHPRGSAPG